VQTRTNRESTEVKFIPANAVGAAPMSNGTRKVELDSSDFHYRASSMLSAVDGDLPVAFEQLVSWDRLG
jgi:hypothetical protein